MKTINRRELLKLGLLSSLTPPLNKAAFKVGNNNEGESPLNILVVVFDALSADNINFHGYCRETMPNLTKLLDKAVVFHNHYAGGPFTTPGTASLLTGTYPWTNRGLRSFGKVEAGFTEKNIFTHFSDYFRFAYTQNPVANILLEQFSHHIDNLLPIQSLYVNVDWVSQLFSHDYDIADLSERQIFLPGNEITYSLLFSNIYQNVSDIKRSQTIEGFADEFPRGLPKHGNNSVDRFFTLEKPTDWLIRSIPNTKTPFLGYFHLLPPHEPYNTRKDCVDVFLNDGFTFMEKPEDFFSKHVTYVDLLEYRRTYDEYVLYVDHEFSRLFEQLKASNLLDNTLVVFTSDHGELFERGIRGHSTAALYVPVVHIPLVMFLPGQQSRVDIHTSTSAVDLLPTLSTLSGHPTPDWCEGDILPPFNDNYAGKDVYSVHSRKYNMGKPINQGSFMLLRENYKYTHYMNYENGKDSISYSELYDIEKDPEEMDNLVNSSPKIAEQMSNTLMDEFNKAEKPYR